ncbi:CaiF/GrlA family transcriptional regulator, partial [Salmonella enterica subsp. enterica]
MTGKLHGSDKSTVPGEDNCTGKEKKVLKKVTQGNHDEYIIPPCMVQWADEPLYMVVARWGMIQRRWINRNDITAVFHITARRASFQLLYISRKKDRVACRVRYMPAKGRGRQRVEIFIDYILTSLEEKQAHVPSRGRNVPAKQGGATSGWVGN